MDSETLAHTKWNCKYHIVFAPKFRRQIVYGKMKEEIGKILRSLCERKEIEILEAELCPDHIHMLISVPPKYSISQIMGYLKGKSSLMIFDKFAQMKYKYAFDVTRKIIDVFNWDAIINKVVNLCCPSINSHPEIISLLWPFHFFALTTIGCKQ